MQFNLFDQDRQDKQRQKSGNALTKSTASTGTRHNALLAGSKARNLAQTTKTTDYATL